MNKMYYVYDKNDSEMSIIISAKNAREARYYGFKNWPSCDIEYINTVAKVWKSGNGIIDEFGNIRHIAQGPIYVDDIEPHEYEYEEFVKLLIKSGRLEKARAGSADYV